MIMRRVATAVLVVLVTRRQRRHGDRGPGRPGASPLKLAGRGFKPHQSVRVCVVSGTRTSTRRVRASRVGRFPR